MALLARTRTDPVLFDLLEESARNVQRTGLLLRDLLEDYPERAHLARDMLLCEQDGDRIAHDIIHRLNDCSPRRCPFDPAEGYQLATTLDDIVDFAEEAATALGTYQVEAPMEQSVAMAEVLIGCGEQIADALRALRSGADLSAQLVEIHRLENQGDSISRAAVASLFANGIDPMVVIRWKDIFESLEGAVDACESVAHVLEGITLRRRSRRR
ncbi:MAG: DUF47 domain-containing protein [Solirubrobacteraceae bacterium]